MMYGKLGANVVVNDMNKENADAVVAAIKAGKFSQSFDYLCPLLINSYYNSWWKGCCLRSIG